MEKFENIYDLIDRYLMGEMDDGQHKEFEAQMEHDAELKQEVESQKELVTVMKMHYKNASMRNELGKIHHDVSKELKLQSHSKKRWINTVIYTSAAASVAVIATFITLYISGWYNYGKHVDAYTELSSKIDNLSSTQASIWEALTVENNDAVPSYPSGTCFVLSEDGLLLTNYHVVRNVDSFCVVNYLDTMIRYRADIIYTDRIHDLAVIKIADSLFTGFGQPPYTFFDDQALMGEYVYTLGYSKKDIVFGEGSVSSITGFNEDSTAYQISIPVNPGNSGGPLIDGNGYILGIISGKSSEKESATFAIKSGYLLTMIDSMKTDSIDFKGLPKYNRLKKLNRKDQIKKLKPFIFKVEVYKSI
ncbi:MAG: serine protease [Bacteroidota bacterium]